MSRIGKQPIEIPSGVDITLADGHIVVKGPKGTLERDLHPEMLVSIEGTTLTVARPSEARTHRSLHGLTRTLVDNMVIGVTTGFSKVLEIQGVGYRATAKGSDIELALGFSHTVPFAAPAGITLTVETPTKIIVSGADKQLVGQTAADIRQWRKVEPYKGKGIRYEGEYVRRKAGKAAK